MTSRPAFRRLAWTAAGFTYALIVLGGIVRVTGSGMGCGDDWPLCRGSLLPPLDLPTLIEYGHRLAASLTGALVLGLAGVAWLRHRLEPELRRPASLAAALLVLQVLLGAVTVKLELPPAVVVLHLAVAMLLLAALLTCALRAALRAPAESAGPRVRRLARASAGAAFLVVFLGGAVANLNAGLACGGFPLCNGALLPAGGTAVHVHAAHRLAAFAFAALLVVTFFQARRSPPAPVAWAAAALAVAAAQIVIAAAMVLQFLPPGWRVAHMAAGTLLWALTVGLAERARALPAPSRSPARELGAAGGRSRSAARVAGRSA